MTAISVEMGAQATLNTVESPTNWRVYEHHIFTEDSNPDRAFEAQLIHAEGYRTAGFVDETALTQDGMTPAMREAGFLGRLVPEIDHARGSQMKYYLTQNIYKPNDSATLRIYNLKPGQTHEDLPAWQLSGSSLSPLGKMLIQTVQDQETRLKEVNALARSSEAHPLTAHAVIRQAIHDAIGNKEFWFCALVASTHTSLVKRFGNNNLKVLGHNVTIDDPRVSKDLELKPIVLRPDEFLDNLVESYNGARTFQEQKKFGETLLFFSDGLLPDKMSAEVRATRQEIYLNRRQKQQ